MAQELGNSRAANIVMMGAFVRQSDIVPPEIYLKTLETIMGSRKKALADINRRAFAAGYEYVQK
jgi:2-oxoglutarate ferredoxin oxidoreductase subunit gamma